MIAPSYNLTATERVLPKLSLDFTTGVLDSRIVVERAGNTATRINASGVIELVNANLPRFDFNPVSLACNGMLNEAATTNMVLNSLIDGTNLSTQAVVVTAVPHTLSFYGSGSVVLSGASVATVVGAGNYPNRQTYTFTPSVGDLTLTISGDVKFAQLEARNYATSFVPTGATVVVRNGELATIVGANFSAFYNASAGTLVAEGFSPLPSAIAVVCMAAAIIDASAMNNALRLERTAGDARVIKTIAGSVSLQTAVWPVNTVKKLGVSYSFGVGYSSINGATAQTLMAGVPTSPTYLVIGAVLPGSNSFNGWVRKVQYYPQQLTPAELQARTK